MLANKFGNTILLISDPEFVQEMMTTKSKYIDKDGGMEAITLPLIKNGFVFSPADEQWKIKRKYSSHAFYKNNLFQMQENLKRVIMQTFSKWLKQIDESPDGRIVIDMS